MHTYKTCLGFRIVRSRLGYVVLQGSGAWVQLQLMGPLTIPPVLAPLGTP